MALELSGTIILLKSLGNGSFMIDMDNIDSDKLKLYLDKILRDNGYGLDYIGVDPVYNFTLIIYSTPQARPIEVLTKLLSTSTPYTSQTVERQLLFKINSIQLH